MSTIKKYRFLFLFMSLFVLAVFVGIGLLGNKAVLAKNNAGINQTVLPATQHNLQQVCQVVSAGTGHGPAALRLPGLPESLFSIPFEKQINFYGLPALLALTLANLFWAVPFINVVRLIQWLLSEPLLGLLRRKKKGFGVVYESLSKKPVDLALVRLIDAFSGKIVSTRVTNRQGQFTFIVPPGRYRLRASKRKYVFPSKFLAGESVDENYGLIAGAQPFTHSGAGSIEHNIPLDAPEDRLSFKAALKRNTRVILRAFFGYVGIILSAASLVLLWNIPALVFFIVHSILFFIFFRLTDTYFGRPWGRVLDKRSGKKLGRAVVRIIDARYKRVLETKVTDRFGLYGFLVGKNDYFLEGFKKGYERHKSSIFKIKNNPGLAGQDLPLTRVSSPQPAIRKNVLT